ncbi:MAG: GNAT family N-acetyltransferase [Promethearchaeota archaeon]
MEITYRNYKTGDETALAELFNRCFTLSGPGFNRSGPSVMWRYVSRPGAVPDEIQIAQIETGEIVGAVYSTLEDYTLGSTPAVVGGINDVTVDPNYVRLGIARELMQRAILYFEKKKCDYAILTADPKGHARKKIYIPLGWRDLCPDFINFSIFSSLIRYLPGLFVLYPIFAFKDMLVYFRYNFYHKRCRHRKICEISFSLKESNRTQYQPLLYQIRDFHNSVTPRHNTGKIHYGSKEWEHFRMQVIPTDLTPKYVILFHGEEIIAYACYFLQVIYFRRLHRQIPLAVVHDFVISHKKISNFGLNKRYITRFLRLSLIESTRHQDCGALLIPASGMDAKFMRQFHFPGFMRFRAANIMINSFGKPPLTTKSFSLPFKISGGESFLYP